MKQHSTKNEKKSFLSQNKALIPLLFLIVALLVFVLLQNTKSGEGEIQIPEATVSAKNSSAYETAAPTGTVIPTPEKETYTEMTLLSAGDIMFHMSQINSAKKADGTYDFSETFRLVQPQIAAADLAVVNFETTLADTNYSGFPAFCAPESGLTAIKNAGFDWLLFANNHCYDRGLSGLLKTQEKFREYGFSYVGATTDPETVSSYGVAEVNGIRLGFLNYTDSITPDSGGLHTINGRTIPSADFPYLNLFILGQEEAFYRRVSEDLQSLKAEGVDFIIAYMHWGIEYDLNQNKKQEDMAQKLCDLGVDVIIGSHPHVIQPMDTFVSRVDSNHTMLCFYSLGNYVSNQNRLTLKTPQTKVYTENGLMVTLTIRKYLDGMTLIRKLDYTPTWVHRYSNGDGGYHYNIVPLPVTDSDSEAYASVSASSFGISHAQDAYKMTNAVLEEPVSVFNEKAREALALFEKDAA